MEARDSLEDRLGALRARIASAARRAGREPAEIVLIAVSKSVTAESALNALALGVSDLGENRVQEAQAKLSVLGREAARWHLIGSLQTNKAGRAAESFDLIHSLDRWELAEALSRAGERLGRPIPVLAQLNISGETSKQGLAPGELHDFLRGSRNLPYLRLAGLMTIAPASADPETSRPIFKQLNSMFQEEARALSLGEAWRYRSMGMSQDFEVAVEEGANLIRIGTALFGSRQSQL